MLPCSISTVTPKITKVPWCRPAASAAGQHALLIQSAPIPPLIQRGWMKLTGDLNARTGGSPAQVIACPEGLTIICRVWYDPPVGFKNGHGNRTVHENLAQSSGRFRRPDPPAKWPARPTITTSHPIPEWLGHWRESCLLSGSEELPHIGNFGRSWARATWRSGVECWDSRACPGRPACWPPGVPALPAGQQYAQSGDAAFEFLELADVHHDRGEAHVVQELSGAGGGRGDQHPVLAQRDDVAAALFLHRAGRREQPGRH